MNFLACNAPIKQLYNLGVEIEENSELDLFEAFNKHAGDERIPAKVAEMAAELGAGVVMCRKPGKLPGETIKESYMKEYGEDTIEIHKDSITEDDVVLIHDDLLATGGSMRAAYDLVQKFHPKKVYINFIIELCIEGLEGRKVFDKDTEISTLMRIE